MRRNCFLSFFLFIGTSVFAQTNVSLVGAGYSEPAPFLVAPGQILALTFRGIGPLPNGTLRKADAGAVPLPKTLAGLAVSITQQGHTAPLAVPLRSVRQTKECATPSPQCYLTSVQVQMPYELTASTTPRLGDKGTKAPDAELVVQADGQASRGFLLRPVSENGHVLTSCDLAGDLDSDSICTRSAYHSNGRAVSMDSPALRGETIIVYAYGLGQTTPAARTGENASRTLATIDPTQKSLLITIKDEFLNASPSLPRAFQAEPFNMQPAHFDFAGLAPGQVGLYQINVPVPNSFSVSVACGPDASIGAVKSNGILQVTTAQGTENVPFCVKP